ncbi:MFS transporter small subunit [Sinomonas notoginsengisoli]
MKTARLVIVWALVGLPLLFGVATTLMKVADLFG